MTELAKLTGGDKNRPVVFYCDANCWMSWNAAKRALVELGYTSVYWYPEGVQGWQKVGPADEPKPKRFRCRISSTSASRYGVAAAVEDCRQFICRGLIAAAAPE